MLEKIKLIYKNRFGITRGKKAPASYREVEGGVIVQTNDGKFFYMPFEMLN